MNRYNVVWNSPSKNASGVMPIGNGNIAAGVYAIENGDLFLLLSKNDAFNFIGDIYKTGRVRISLDPNPLQKGKPFRQTLDLPTGSILIEADQVTLRIWADAHRAVYHVEINSPRELAVTARPEFWKRHDFLNEPLGHAKEDVYARVYSQSVLSPPGNQPVQDVRLDRKDKILWYFAVGDRSVYPEDLKYYDVEQMAGTIPDPFRFNTFGNLLESRDLTLDHGNLSGKGKKFDIHIHGLTLQTPNPEAWIIEIEHEAAMLRDIRKDWEAHCKWWADFWNRSWIIASNCTLPPGQRERLSGEASATGSREEKDGAAVVAQAYNVFRYLMACQSRGRIQTKFNGGLFTQQLHVPATDNFWRLDSALQPDGSWLTHEDDRRWTSRFTFQNQRLLYWPLLASGDFDLMKPFFDYYSNLLPMRRAITMAWFGHDGAYFRENITPTGAEIDDVIREGIQTNKPPRTKPGEKYSGSYHDYYFTSGLEITVMMIDYVNFTGDTAFRDRVLLPFAREVLLFFDQHYPRGADGKLRIEPGQALETWWIATNAAPDVAGLQFALDELLAMKAGTSDDQARWTRFRAEIPQVPLQTVNGRPVLAPAAKFEHQANFENAELYPVFPFRCFGGALGSKDLVESTMKNRTWKDAGNGSCWTQDQIHWAYAGKAAEAAAGLEHRFRIASTGCRFPMYGSEGFDSCPDFDHFGAGSVALQRMLVQEANGKILLLPAWPANWDADFKLHLTGGAILTGTVKDGNLTGWDIQPANRKQDVVICQPQVFTCPLD